MVEKFLGYTSGYVSRERGATHWDRVQTKRVFSRIHDPTWIPAYSNVLTELDPTAQKERGKYNPMAVVQTSSNGMLDAMVHARLLHSTDYSSCAVSEKPLNPSFTAEDLVGGGWGVWDCIKARPLKLTLSSRSSLGISVRRFNLPPWLPCGPPSPHLCPIKTFDMPKTSHLIEWQMWESGSQYWLAGVEKAPYHLQCILESQLRICQRKKLNSSFCTRWYCSGTGLNGVPHTCHREGARIGMVVLEGAFSSTW